MLQKERNGTDKPPCTTVTLYQHFISARHKLPVCVQKWVSGLFLEPPKYVSISPKAIGIYSNVFLESLHSRPN